MPIFGKKEVPPPGDVGSAYPARPLFGGVDPDELADGIGAGFATWLDTDAADSRAVAAHGAMIARAPIDVAFDTATDFRATHNFIPVARPGQILEQDEDEVVIRFGQGVGLGALSLGLHQSFRLRLEPPAAIHCVEYCGGSFPSAFFEMRFHALSDRHTLVGLAFICDLASLGVLSKTFFERLPELEFAITNGVALVPLSGYVAEANRRAQELDCFGAELEGTPRGLWQQLVDGRLSEPLEHGYLTVGRVDSDGEIVDVASATRVAARADELWPVMLDGSRLRDVLTFIETGRMKRSRPDEVESELQYRLRLGPISKRYIVRRRARTCEPYSVESIEAEVDGRPLQVADYAIARGDESILCHKYYSDVKADRISRIFLARHPEFERLISTYPPAIMVRAYRQKFGAPRLQARPVRAVEAAT